MANTSESLQTSNNASAQTSQGYSLFLGCVIPNRYPMIERATRSVFTALGIPLHDMIGASCCPAPGVFRSVDKALWMSLGARNLTIAEQNGTDCLTLCNGCYGTLLDVEHRMKTEPNMNERINKILKTVGREFLGKVHVRHIIEVLYFDIGLNRIKSLVKKPLGLRVAVHYGCHLLKPSIIRPFHGETEDPHFFDEIVETLGCESVPYNLKLQCCGAGGGVRTSLKDTSLKFTLEKLRQIRRTNPDCIVVACPFCQLQFDLGQVELSDQLDEDEPPFKIPVIYISQLVGMAMGLDVESLGLIKPEYLPGISPFTPITPIVEKIYPSKTAAEEVKKHG